ncbi:L-threonine 3-dehydrogenase [Alkalicoccus chagannorensis]|uniref:L-threonine 3-dehydrogenase n=1 Tax=Alkalicoccus chagannorensis TaxID=427072 RepID=UPI00040D8E08|nr:L-threonine 3-dehydrogenase [Alkalicoccus chagannorensis]
MTEVMKALVKHERGPGAEMTTVPVPEPGSFDVKIRVEAASICGTDVHIYNWDDWSASRVKPPYTFGHEFSGEVVETGSQVKHVQAGDFVSAETHIVCGRCRQCRSGNAHICAETKIIGVDTHGCFAEYVVLPEENIWKNDPSLSWEEASLQEPMGNAVHTVMSADPTAKTAAVIGCGPIGLMAVSIARAAGASRIFALDLNEYRLELAEKMGATDCIHSLQMDPLHTIMTGTGGEGVDVVYEMSGHPVAMNQGFKMAANGGQVSILSLPIRPVEIDVTNDIVFKGLRVQGITGRRMFETWQQTSGLLHAGRVDLKPLITHVLPMEEFEKGFALMNEGRCGKVILKPQYQES